MKNLLKYLFLAVIVSLSGCKDRSIEGAHTVKVKSVEQVEGLYDTKIIKIGAQKYLRKFYESLGFISTDEFYMEDGIPHLYMIKGEPLI